jgi:DNA-binding transcriptional ArsR family regulator
VATAFAALAEPTRREILDLLVERPRLVGELTERLGLTQPGTSKHLRVLREAGLVSVRRDRLWREGLDALERHLDAMPEGDDGGTS